MALTTKGYTLPSGVTTADQVKQIQSSLGVTADGIWGPKTQSAYDANKKAGNGSGYKITMSDYVTPWANKTEADAANNAWMRQAGLMPGEQPVYHIANSADMDNFRKTYGMYGQDGTGGIFNPAGYSSNPYYLQTMTGITRDMTKGTVLENVPDKIIGGLVKTATPWDNDSWIDPNTGATSSVQQAGFYNKGELRKALAGLTNQQYQYTLGIQNRAAPLMSPGSLGGSDLGALQAALLEKNQQTGGYIPAIGVNAGIWQSGTSPSMGYRTLIDEMVNPSGIPSAPAAGSPELPPNVVDDVIGARALEEKRRKERYNING